MNKNLIQELEILTKMWRGAAMDKSSQVCKKDFTGSKHPKDLDYSEGKLVGQIDIYYKLALEIEELLIFHKDQ